MFISKNTLGVVLIAVSYLSYKGYRCHERKKWVERNSLHDNLSDTSTVVVIDDDNDSDDDNDNDSDDDNDNDSDDDTDLNNPN